MRYVFSVIASLLIFSNTCDAGYIPNDPERLPPPPPLAPRTNTLTPLSGTDSATTTYPGSNMDTIQIQSLGTSGDNHPQSHPIPLDQVPNRLPDEIPAQSQ